ncbi:unnamed protein product, partial [Musa textilis]
EEVIRDTHEQLRLLFGYTTKGGGNTESFIHVYQKPRQNLGRVVKHLSSQLLETKAISHHYDWY